MITWSYRHHDGRTEPGTLWRDSAGDVRLVLSYTSGIGVGVVYERAGVKYQLGQRRFLRDFVIVSNDVKIRAAR